VPAPSSDHFSQRFSRAPYVHRARADRTSRIPELLAETSTLTQIVIFTLHRHVVTAAEAIRAVTPDGVLIHAIEPAPAAP